MRTVSAALVLASIVLLIPVGAKAGGWTRDQGGVFVRAGAGAFFGEQPFAVGGEVGAPEGTFRGIAGELYGEVGLGARLEIDASLRFVDNAHSLNDGRTLHNTGFEELELYLKWGPVSGSDAIAFLIGGRVALYERLPIAEALEGMPERGPGGQDLLFGVSFGHSFHPAEAWVNVDLVHRIRLASPSSGLLLRAEAGSRLVGPLLGALTFELMPAFGRDIDIVEGGVSPVPKSLAFGAKLFVDLFEGFGLLADGAWLPDVLNDGPGFRVGLGVTYQRD